MMTDDLDEIGADLAEELLEACLNKEDLRIVRDVSKDISFQIRWGKVIQKVLPELHAQVEDLLDVGFEFPGRTYLKGPIWGKVIEQEADEFEEEAPRHKPRRQMLVLKLLRKLLMSARTVVDQQINSIPILTAQEEVDLWEIATLDDTYESTKKGEAPPEGRIIEAGIEVVKNDCDHNHSEVRQRLKKEHNLLEFYCLDCKTVYKSKVTSSIYSSNPQICQHINVGWRKGEEGRTAECRECQEEIPNPEIYDWVGAGLEPVGDNPEEDEVITLCSKY